MYGAVTHYNNNKKVIHEQVKYNPYKSNITHTSQIQHIQVKYNPYMSNITHTSPI